MDIVNIYTVGGPRWECVSSRILKVVFQLKTKKRISKAVNISLDMKFVKL